MFNKLSLALLVSASLSCVGQVTTMGGTATTAGPGVAVVPLSAANAPLISTPDIALPGSGPAVGAPLSSAAANDSRSSSGPSVYNPNSTGYVGAEANAAAAPATVAPAQPAGVPGSSTPQPFENGIQRFQSGMPNSGNATMSLAQIARNYRAQHHQSARSFNNDSIAQMNAAGVRTGNLGPETSTIAAASPAPGPAQNGEGTLVAENQPPALPQSDQPQPAPGAEPSTSQVSSTASQQRHANVEPAPADPTTASASQTPASPEMGQNAGTAKLPQTASPLPLLLLLGGIGVAGGAVYWLRK